MLDENCDCTRTKAVSRSAKNHLSHSLDSIESGDLSYCVPESNLTERKTLNRRRRGRLLNVELTANELNCFDLTLHTVLTREETMEMIVPDACPDIATLLDTDAVPNLQSKECGEGCLTLSGVAVCHLLYQPEGGGVRQLRAEIPFQFATELDAFQPQTKCVILPCVSLAETRVMNPRKVLIKVELCFTVTAYEPTQLCCCREIPECDALGIEQRTERRRGSFAVHIGERPFTYEDEVQIPSSKPAMRELLRVRAQAFCSEARMIGGKLVFKGGSKLRALYLSEDGQLCTAEFELPFSQVAEVGLVSENASFQLELTVVRCVAEQSDAEGRYINVTLELTAQVVIREEQELEVVTDAYSIRGIGTPSFLPYQLPRVLEQGSRRQTAHEMLETAASAQEICDARAYVGQVRQVGGALSAELRVVVLYQTEEHSYSALTRQMQVKCACECGEGQRCIGVGVLSDVSATAMSGGVEVRLNVDFHVLAMDSVRFYSLSAFELDNEQPLNEEHTPSVVLRQVTEGETLWEIAKAYRTTRSEIEQANSLSAEPTAGQMLLIPRKR